MEKNGKKWEEIGRDEKKGRNGKIWEETGRCGKKW